MASVNQRKTLDGERQRVGELVQPPREVSHQPPGQRHLDGDWFREPSFRPVVKYSATLHNNLFNSVHRLRIESID
ncbi:hypothetical protein FOIG_05030 [Fusarium odoratissimum NRRL 54006]|uniref:Uncharacterized protein n=1 Tax=Fusarium odoratissimum (strain NRRL 54006) TaxID=1089451 RepID=X0JUD8_FUSO5|nr:uncharacterized protein FOIG_05030 [Fusarium odoratissimum NRRL 54006]EXM04894.1 hypothetical protein FOIG_05030 [Fusarium odoratissimum NRRL 54006]